MQKGLNKNNANGKEKCQIVLQNCFLLYIFAQDIKTIEYREALTFLFKRDLSICE